jgi:hypothetical protein
VPNSASVASVRKSCAATASNDLVGSTHRTEVTAAGACNSFSHNRTHVMDLASTLGVYYDAIDLTWDASATNSSSCCGGNAAGAQRPSVEVPKWVGSVSTQYAAPCSNSHDDGTPYCATPSIAFASEPAPLHSPGPQCPHTVHYGDRGLATVVAVNHRLHAPDARRMETVWSGMRS